MLTAASCINAGTKVDNINERPTLNDVTQTQSTHHTVTAWNAKVELPQYTRGGGDEDTQVIVELTVDWYSVAMIQRSYQTCAVLLL